VDATVGEPHEMLSAIQPNNMLLALADLGAMVLAQRLGKTGLVPGTREAGRAVHLCPVQAGIAPMLLC